MVFTLCVHSKSDLRGLFVHHVGGTPWYRYQIHSSVSFSIQRYRRVRPRALANVHPWVLTVWGYGKVRRWGAVYFSSVGAVLTLVLGCITSSLSPKPLFIEDQTFIEGVMMAAQRQGIPMLTAGAVFGIAYWLISERKK